MWRILRVGRIAFNSDTVSEEVILPTLQTMIALSSAFWFVFFVIAATMIPMYVLFPKMGWIGTFLPLIVPNRFAGGAFNIFLLRQFFRTIPMELEEAALLDGASYVSSPRFLCLWRGQL